MKIIDITPEGWNCLLGSCPAVFRTDSGSYVLIARTATPETRSMLANRVGEGEVVVEFPADLLEKAITSG